MRIKHFLQVGIAALGIYNAMDGLEVTNLDDLSKCDKATALHNLESAELPILWDFFLKGQADLFLEWDIRWLSRQDWWTFAETVLDLGSGNGIYLEKLAEKFPDKTYLGLEKQTDLVEKSPKLSCLSFEVGDAEIENEAFVEQFDVVLLRLTLQHLANPEKALKNAYHYLKPKGHALIIDAYDEARRSSHLMPTFEQATRLHNECNKKEAKGNRHVTLELLNALQSENPLENTSKMTTANFSDCSSLFAVLWSNLDNQGKTTGRFN